MQALPEIPVDEVIDIASSNASQQRGTHGLFRYFGKLAPDVTGRVLDLCIERVKARQPSVVDVMSGSGTTLIECADRGIGGVGVDVNPVANLYARVKTQSVRRETYFDFLSRIEEAKVSNLGTRARMVFSATRNADRWFNEEVQREIARLRLSIDKLPPSRERSLLLAVLLGCLRKFSNASGRTGRIFFDPDSASRQPLRDFLKAAEAAVELVPEEDLDASVIASDARCIPIRNQQAHISFCHPPYFALYRFSADVLRFELEVAGWSRARIAASEVEEGWKSGDVSRLELYVRDMGNVFTEARRVTRRGGVFALVASNSTLGDVQLPVIDRLAHTANEAGWKLERHLERRAHHGSASYHRSARTDKVIQQDHVLLFRR